VLFQVYSLHSKFKVCHDTFSDLKRGRDECAPTHFRFTDSDTVVETVVLRMIVVEPESSLVELGSTPLVVPRFYGLSNAIDGGILSIRSPPDVACTVRLLTPETSVPSLGQLVTEDDPGLRKGKAWHHPYPATGQHVGNAMVLKVLCENVVLL
jgi:hypothetical protein